MNYFKILIVLTLTGFASKAIAQTHEPRRLNWDTLTTENFSISYPSNWDLDTTGMMGSHFFLFSPITSEQDTFRENINLMTQDLTGMNVSIEDFVTTTKEQVGTLLANGEFISSAKKAASDNNCHHLKYIGDQGVYKLAFDQYVWVEDEVASILTFTGEQDKYEKYKDFALRIMDSFKILKAFEKEPVTTNSISTANGFHDISNSKYEIKIPENWTIQDGTAMGLEVLALSGLENEEDKFNESISIVTESLQGTGMTLQQYSELTLTNIQLTISDFKLLSTEVVGKGSDKHQEIIFTGSQGEIPLKYHQIYFVKDDTAYVVGYTSEISQYDASKEAREQILSTFKLKN